MSPRARILTSTSIRWRHRSRPGRPDSAIAATPTSAWGRTLTLVLAGAIVLAGCADASSAHRSRVIPHTHPALVGLAATVTHVVDGDTVDVQVPGAGPERARLLGIDTPETVKPNTPVQCFGPEASARTKALLPPGTPVLLQRDEEARDRYGRILVYVWRAGDGLFVNGELVTEGLARTLSIEPNTAHRADLAHRADQARTGGTGLWSRCPDPASQGRSGP